MPKKRILNVAPQENQTVSWLLYGQTREQFEGRKQWRNARFINMWVNHLTSLNLLATWICFFVLGELLVGMVFFALFFIWFAIAYFKTDRFVRFIGLSFCVFFITVTWVRYTGITSTYVYRWWGFSNFLPPCGQSACTRDTVPPDNNVPYNAIGYFSASVPDVAAINLICPVNDCFWGAPIPGQVIQTYAEDGTTGLPNFNEPCNDTNIVTCEYISSTRPQDYFDSEGRPIVGIGVAGGANAPATPDSPEVVACNNALNSGDCTEAFLPDGSNLVCTQCSSWFASRGLLPSKYSCCGPVLDECVLCPGAIPMYPNQRIDISTLQKLSVTAFVFFIIQLIVYVLSLINLEVKQLEDDAAKTPKSEPRRCRPGIPPFFARRTPSTVPI